MIHILKNMNKKDDFLFNNSNVMFSLVNASNTTLDGSLSNSL